MGEIEPEVADKAIELYNIANPNWQLDSLEEIGLVKSRAEAWVRVARHVLSTTT